MKDNLLTDMSMQQQPLNIIYTGPLPLDLQKKPVKAYSNKQWLIATSL